MIPEERRIRIIDKINDQEICSINDLVDELNVSRITVQRDINILEKRGLIEKVHGGIRHKKLEFPRFEMLFLARMNQNRDKKIEIASKAVQFVHDHTTIFLDSSSTAYFFAKELFTKKFLDLVVVTNSPAILCEALKTNEYNVLSTGGLLRQNFNMLAGKWVIDFLETVNIQQAFLSTAGISPNLFLTTSNSELADILRCVIERANIVNLLADSTKFFKATTLDIVHLSKCNRLISDGDIKEKMDLDEISKIDIEIIY